MSPFKISFDSMQWQQVRPDVRQKVHCEGSRQGDGLFIPSGAESKHRAVSISAGTQLLVVEEL